MIDMTYEQYIRNLDDRKKKIISLHEQGYKRKDISKILKVTPNIVTNTLCRHKEKQKYYGVL